MLAETEPWWEQAQADAKCANVLLTAGHYYAVSFFAQQAAEKALKAVLVERRSGQQPPRTHDLRYLGARVAAPAGIHVHLGVLYPVFQLARYPIGGNAPVNTITEPDARAHLAAANEVLTWTARHV